MQWMFGSMMFDAISVGFGLGVFGLRPRQADGVSWPSSVERRYMPIHLRNSTINDEFTVIAKCSKSWILGLLNILYESLLHRIYCTGCLYKPSKHMQPITTQNAGFYRNSSPFHLCNARNWVSRSWLSGALSRFWDGVSRMI